MNFYGCTPTVKGRSLIAKLLSSKTLEITKVMVGSGCYGEGELSAIEELAQPVGQGTYTSPTYDGDSVLMTVEYRNDLNGGLDNGFWLNEFGVYANDPDVGEILLYYCCLGDFPQYVSGYSGSNLETRRFPISITVGEGVAVVVESLPSAFMTAEEVAKYCEDVVLPKVNAEIENLKEEVESMPSGAVVQPIVLDAESWVDGEITTELNGVTEASFITLTFTSESTEVEVDGFTSAMIVPGEQGEGYFKLRALGTVPSVDISLFAVVEG